MTVAGRSAAFASALVGKVGDESVAEGVRRRGGPRADADHGRLLDGPSEVMLEAAYTGWQSSEQTGEAALLVTTCQRRVELLPALGSTAASTSGLPCYCPASHPRTTSRAPRRCTSRLMSARRFAPMSRPIGYSVFGL